MGKPSQSLIDINRERVSYDLDVFEQNAQLLDRAIQHCSCVLPIVCWLVHLLCWEMKEQVACLYYYRIDACRVQVLQPLTYLGSDGNSFFEEGHQICQFGKVRTVGLSILRKKSPQLGDPNVEVHAAEGAKLKIDSVDHLPKIPIFRLMQNRKVKYWSYVCADTIIWIATEGLSHSQYAIQLMLFASINPADDADLTWVAP